jgi:hypothetical protein
MQFGERKLADPIDRDEPVEPALFRQERREVDVDIPERIGLELSAGPRAFGVGQTADLVALKQPVQRRPCQMRDRRL